MHIVISRERDWVALFNLGQVRLIQLLRSRHILGKQPTTNTEAIILGGTTSKVLAGPDPEEPERSKGHQHYAQLGTPN